MKRKMDEESLKYEIALSLLPNIGDTLAKRLVAHCGSAEAVFREKKAGLEKIPGIGRIASKSIVKHSVFERAEQEIKFIRKHRIQPVFFLSEQYPKRLLHCEDSPVMLYLKGNTGLNHRKVISIVGTRTATDYGKELCEKLVADLAFLDPLVVSGLAYGIDICAHRAALDNGLQTIGVLGHGLDKIYPPLHRPTAEKMVAQGGVLTDYISGTVAKRDSFPARNRIVAGMSDATIVIESRKEGGSLITADIANSYNRDVFAFPGRVGDVCSEGCNNLIRQNKAALVQTAKDILYIMGWDEEKNSRGPAQRQLFIELRPEEETILSVLRDKVQLNVDDLSLLAGMPMSKVSAALLSLEFSGMVRSMPGKVYKVG